MNFFSPLKGKKKMNNSELQDETKPFDYGETENFESGCDSDSDSESGCDSDSESGCDSDSDSESGCDGSDPGSCSGSDSDSDSGSDSGSDSDSDSDSDSGSDSGFDSGSDSGSEYVSRLKKELIQLKMENLRLKRELFLNEMTPNERMLVNTYKAKVKDRRAKGRRRTKNLIPCQSVNEYKGESYDNSWFHSLDGDEQEYVILKEELARQLLRLRPSSNFHKFAWKVASENSYQNLEILNILLDGTPTDGLVYQNI